MNNVIRGHTLLLLFLGFCIGLGTVLLVQDIRQATEVAVPPPQEQTNVMDVTLPPTPASQQIIPPSSPTLKYINEAGVEVAKSDLPTLQITQPSGGRSLKIGTTHYIMWTTTHDKDITAVSIHIAAHNSDCTVGDCATVGDIVAERVVGTNSFAWKVANTLRNFSMPPGKYVISLRGMTNYKMKNAQGEAPYIATAQSEVFTVVQ